MKVLFIASNYQAPIVGGGQRSLQLLAKTLYRKGHDVTVLTLDIPGKTNSKELEGVKVERVALKNIYQPFYDGPQPGLKKALWHMLDTYNLAMAKVVKEAVSRMKPDVVNTQVIAGFSVAIWRAVKSCGIPVVHTLRDQYLLCPRSTMFRNGRQCKKQCLTCKAYSWPRIAATQHVDAAIGVSRFILDRHRAYGCFPNACQAVVYNPFESPDEVPNLEKIKAAQEHPLRFGFLGCLRPHKGIEHLLKAFLSLEPGMAELWVAGKGEAAYETKLKDLAGNHDDVRWLGFVKPDSLLDEIDVMVVPSLWQDTFPRVPVEAFNYALPVIGSNRGGIPELITDETGWMYEPDEPGALKSCLRRCVEQQAILPEMGMQARKRARQFSCEANVRGCLEVYEFLLGRR